MALKVPNPGIAWSTKIQECKKFVFAVKAGVQKVRFCRKSRSAKSPFLQCKNIFFALLGMYFMLKRYGHNPAHLFLDNTIYFITAATYKKRPLLTTHELKCLLIETIKTAFEQYAWQLHHWVILDNHYHLLGQSRKGEDLSKIMKSIHIPTAMEIRQATQCEKPVWWNYWDYCPRDHKESMIRQNYLLYNPAKHGYVTNLQEYLYSSFHEAFQQLGRDRLAEQFRNYPEYKTLQLPEAENDDF